MTNILAEVGELAQEIEAASVDSTDRDRLLQATSKIGAQADWVVKWLLEVRLDESRH